MGPYANIALLGNWWSYLGNWGNQGTYVAITFLHDRNSRIDFRSPVCKPTPQLRKLDARPALGLHSAHVVPTKKSTSRKARPVYAHSASLVSGSTAGARSRGMALARALKPQSAYTRLKSFSLAQGALKGCSRLTRGPRTHRTATWLAAMCPFGTMSKGQYLVCMRSRSEGSCNLINHR